MIGNSYFTTPISSLVNKLDETIMTCYRFSLFYYHFHVDRHSVLINPENRRNAINRFHGPKVIVLYFENTLSPPIQLLLFLVLNFSGCCYLGS